MLLFLLCHKFSDELTDKGKSKCPSEVGTEKHSYALNKYLFDQIVIWNIILWIEESDIPLEKGNECLFKSYIWPTSLLHIKYNIATI